jgi:signal transduction histidine kinase
LAIRVEDTVAEVESSLREQGFNPLMRVDSRTYTYPPVLQTTISRVLREGSTNIIRYAQPATSCTFLAIVAPDQVVMCVSSALRLDPPDNQTGHSTGLGLVGLGERLRLVHGQFTAGPENDLWVIRAIVPRT